MRLKPKFKIFKQLKYWPSIDYFPKKLFTTKKKSWRILFSSYKQKFRLKKNKKQIHKNFKITPKPAIQLRRWSYQRNFYKQGLLVKRLYYHTFNSNIKNKILNQRYLNATLKYNQNLFINSMIYFIKPNFKLDILLWVLGFFHSTYEARNSIFYKNIILNTNKMPHPNNMLFAGDIISIIPFKKNLTFKNIIQKKIVLQVKFNFFCEVDYYTKTIILINDFSNTLQSAENPQLFFKKIDVRNFISYLKREH